LNNHILDREIQDFIINYPYSSSKLAFAGSPFIQVTVQELLQQIESRRKIKTKLPTWYKNARIYYPPKLNLEQTSSELTAKYKASLISGDSLADITGGFGVDSYYFSERINTVDYFEINEKLSKIAKHNFNILRASNVQCFADNGLEKVLKNTYKVIYADPSRRHDKKGKVYLLEDCEPNIPKNVNQLLDQCEVLMLKTSPMLDISAGLAELNCVFQIHIVAVNNEVKELIWLLKKGSDNRPRVYTINLKNNSSETFNFLWEAKAETSYSDPLKFLYEPNVAILKSGSFSLLSEEFKVKKLHKHSHLYTSNTIQNFPGRVFIIEQVIPYSKSELRKKINFKTANITTRNFPESVASLRKKWKISEGGNRYLFFTMTANEKKVVILCSKVS
jgi:hypothetical protein